MYEYTYRIYVTDSLYLQTQNKGFSERWCDLIDPKKAMERQKSGDEIAAEVMANAGLKFGG